MFLIGIALILFWWINRKPSYPAPKYKAPPKPIAKFVQKEDLSGLEVTEEGVRVK